MGSGSAVPDLKTVIPYVKRKVLQVGVLSGRLIFFEIVLVPVVLPLSVMNQNWNSLVFEIKRLRAATVDDQIPIMKNFVYIQINNKKMTWPGQYFLLSALEHGSYPYYQCFGFQEDKIKLN
jgi:hypothetical protein